MQPSMERAQQRLLAPLKAAEQESFVKLMQQLILANNSASRAPMPKNMIRVEQS